MVSIHELIKRQCIVLHSMSILCDRSNVNVSWVKNTNLLLTEREGRTGEYWPEVVTVRTEHCEVRTKTSQGQYSPVRLEQARLVSSLLYGTRLMICILLSNALPGQLNSKDFRRVMTRATQKEQATTTLKRNSLNIFRKFYKRNFSGLGAKLSG